MGGDTNKKLLEVTEESTKEETLKTKILIESKKIWIVAGPAIVTRWSTFGITVISQAFIGHLGTTELAAFSLVFTVLLRFASSIMLGMNSGLGTLCGQAYGARRYHMLGIYLQQSWIFMTTTATLLIPLFIFAAPILKALGQEEHIVEMAGYMALWFIPVIYSYVVSFSCQMYLQSQSKNLVITYFSLFSLLIHIFLSWLLTVRCKFGIPGAMVSTIVAYMIPSIGQLVYIMLGGCQQTWRGFTLLAFKDLGPIIKLSLSSGAMICLELWYNSILLLLTGNMKNAEVTIDALSICLNISGWLVMISIGFLSSASVRVSNELGRRDPNAAKFSTLVIVLMSFAIAFVLFLVFLFLKGNLAYMFTKSQAVVAAVDRLSPLLAFTILLNGVQPVLSGVANGAGWQSTVAYVNLASYYLIGIPLGVILGYAIKLQVEGVWVGMILGTVVQTVILLIMTCRTDWDKQVVLAQARVNRCSIGAEISSNSSSNNDSEAASRNSSVA